MAVPTPKKSVDFYRLNPADLSVRRPVAVCMFFAAIVIVGIVAIFRIPVELIPNLEGETLLVSFSRPGSDATVLEREILLPLQARVSEISNVVETRGTIFGSFGRFVVTLERGTDVKKREHELNRIVASIRNDQPRGTGIRVQTFDTSALSAQVMTLHVLAATDDTNAIRDIANELIAPRLSSVPGTSQVGVQGGASTRLTIEVDPARMAAFGLTSDEVTRTVNRQFGDLVYLGKNEDQDGRIHLLLDGRAAGIESVASARVGSGTGAPQLRNIATLSLGPGHEETRSRVNGKPSVSIDIYKEQSANSIEIGRSLRARVDEVRSEMASLGIDLYIGSDAGEELEDQLKRLGGLGLSGYLIALLALFVFFRQWRAVAVVGVAVPVSVLGAIGALYLLGETLNLITIFGLAIAIGLLVDNSVVVYESILRQMERGAGPEEAVRRGIRRTIRAIFAASVTTAVVFLPPFIVDLGSQMVEALFQLVAVSILLPMGTSLLVAVGLVPVLAHRLVAGATLSTLDRNRRIRAERGGLKPPDRTKILLGGFLAHALRHPPAWITGTVFAIALTVIIGFPLVPQGNPAATRADKVQFESRFAGPDRPVDVTSDAMTHVELALLDIEGVESVRTTVRTEGARTNVHLVDEAERPEDLTIPRILSAARRAAEPVPGLEIFEPGEMSARGGQGGVQGGRTQSRLLGGRTPVEIKLSGPDSATLMDLAEELRFVLKNTEESVASAWISVARGNPEIWIEPVGGALESFGVTSSEVLRFLSLAGRDGIRAENNYVLRSGREVPVVTERKGARDSKNIITDLSSIRIATESGELPADSLVTTRKMPAAPVIEHRDGRREMSVFFRYANWVEESGPSRQAVEQAVEDIIHSVRKNAAYTIEIAEDDEGVSLISKVFLPLLLLLYLVLAFAFESLILPPLVMLAIPLTVLGATWALVLARLPFSEIAALGAVALVGISVNASILLVDRIQQKVLRAGWSPGAAALAAVKERARPLLMTSATTIAALWPLAVATGRENEIWPPFATLMIGGMATSTLLVVLVVPVGYILLHRLETLFGRVGPWLVLAWSGLVTGIIAPLIHFGVLESLLWRVVCTVLVMGAMLALVVLIFRRRPKYSPDASDGPPLLDVRNLRKTYDQPGPVHRAIHARKEFARKVVERGGIVFSPRGAIAHVTVLLIIGAAFGYLGSSVDSAFWGLMFWFVTVYPGRLILQEIRKLRGKVTAEGVAQRGGVEGYLAIALPWLVIAGFFYVEIVVPHLADESRSTGVFWTVLLACILLLFQLLRRSALQMATSGPQRRAHRGMFRRVRAVWRTVASRVVGFDQPAKPVVAVAGVSFKVKRGMVGVLGPNGAGKTTLLRQLAGIIDPTWGTITLGGVRLSLIRKRLAHWVGYLPQDAGLPERQSPRQYLMYFAALYELPAEIRSERVDGLLKEVGLEDKARDNIGSLSGGMRQRVAVARTLLRLPDVIIVDEPTVGLDPRERIRFRNLLGTLARDRIVLFSTHVVEDVAVACERVLVMANSQLCFDGSPSELAHLAQGKVWETERAEGEAWELPEGTILASESAILGEKVVSRLITVEPPDSHSRSLDPTPEDGYLWLTERSAAGLAS